MLQEDNERQELEGHLLPETQETHRTKEEGVRLEGDLELLSTRRTGDALLLLQKEHRVLT